MVEVLFNHKHEAVNGMLFPAGRIVPAALMIDQVLAYRGAVPSALGTLHCQFQHFQPRRLFHRSSSSRIGFVGTIYSKWVWGVRHLSGVGRPGLRRSLTPALSQGATVFTDWVA